MFGTRSPIKTFKAITASVTLSLKMFPSGTPFRFCLFGGQKYSPNFKSESFFVRCKGMTESPKYGLGKLFNQIKGQFSTPFLENLQIQKSLNYPEGRQNSQFGHLKVLIVSLKYLLNKHL